MSCAKSQPFPYQLVSLMGLLEMYAGAYWRIAGMIGQLVTHFEAGSHGIPLSLNVYQQFGDTLVEIKREMEKLGLTGALNQIQRLSDDLNHTDNFTDAMFHRRIVSIHERIMDDLSDRLFLCVPSEMTEFYRQKQPLFGDAVTSKFPQMTEDISEAGKCLSLRRPTAAVFHLMRVMELALQSFGSKIGVTLVHEKNWQNILDEANKKIRALDQKLLETKKYAEASSHLYNVKLAWRNEVMHPKQTYTDEEAHAIFGSVRTFVRDLADLI
jgi:hypothetical protein